MDQSPHFEQVNSYNVQIIDKSLLQRVTHCVLIKKVHSQPKPVTIYTPYYERYLPRGTADAEVRAPSTETPVLSFKPG